MKGRSDCPHLLYAYREINR